MADAATPYPLQWPAGKARTLSADRKYPIFRSALHGDNCSGTKPVTVAVALDRLTSELAALGVRYPVVSTNLEIRRDGFPRGGQRDPEDPGVAVYFQLAGKPHCLPCDTYQTVAANIAAVAAHIKATRAIERHGVASLNEMFAGFAALPSPSDERPWRQVFEFHRESCVTLKMTEAAYRRLASERHPDRGGSDVMMAELNRARADARREFGV